jgi:hypothetical protein
MPTFATDLHESHDWNGIEPNWPGRMCHRCEICTCHDSGYSARPCGEVFTDLDRELSANAHPETEPK